ncbi:MAG: hypothetical protein V4621_01860 [Pseudomonadota bacterium]
MISLSWILFALLAAICAAGVPLTQERNNANPYALVIWVKLFCVAFATPFVLTFGLPDAPMFYVYTAAGAGLWCVSDILYFRALPHIGAGVMTRLLPGATLLTFLLWFVIDPALLQTYLNTPIKLAAICVVLCFAAACAALLHRCQVSRAAFSQVWFVILAAAVGPVLAKAGFAYTDLGGNRWHAAFAYLFVNAALMLVIWAPYYAIKKPVPVRVFLDRTQWDTALKISLCVAGMTVFQSLAYMAVDHPAFVAVVLMTDAVWVLVIYRLMQRQETANIAAGLGIVAAAVTLVLVKNFL